MSGYFPGTTAEVEGMQTLYLMKPGYTGFPESSSSSNVAFINSFGTATNQDTHFDHLGVQQQQHGGLTLSSLTPAAVYQNSHLASNQHLSTSMFATSANGHGSGWNEGNTFSLVPPTDMVGKSGSLGVINVVHQSTNDSASIPNGITLDVESLQPSGSAGQILSLSLSPQLQTIARDGDVNECSGFSNIRGDNWGRGESIHMGDGGLGSFRAASQDNVLHGGLQTLLVNSRQINSNTALIELYRSKYLKLAQQLLDEVVSVGRDTKGSSINSTQVVPWKDANKVPSAKENNLSDSFRKDQRGGSWTMSKEGHSYLPSTQENSDIPKQSAGSMIELTLAERHDLQMKKTKLMTMLDEVDRQYRQYYHQVQVVVGSFELTAGLGAAHTYTTLALQTISRHFRCLKDAIRTQIRVACRSLGEDDVLGPNRGEPSRLCFIDQRLSQQRAFQQLGMIQQPTWRPQRGLPERSVTILRAWLFDHFLHPYPKDSDKHMLARQTGLTRNQVSNWFINARVRLWKPMIEEMYAEEIKEGENEVHQWAEDEVNKRGVNCLLEGGTSEPTGITMSPNLRDGNIDSYTSPKNMLGIASSMLPRKSLEEISQSLFQGTGSVGHMMKRAKHIGPESTILNTCSGTQMEFKPGPPVHNMKVQTDEGFMDDFSMTDKLDNELGHLNDQKLRGYTTLPLMRLLRYPHGGLDSSCITSSGVSLTLGLQQSDGLSLMGTQSSVAHGPQYVMEQQMFKRVEDGVIQVDYYSMNETVGGPAGEYGALETKRYGTPAVHDFT